jgi:small-conductance mechanosensitive channel
MANESQTYSDMASSTNALERIQQKIGEEADSLRPENTDMAFKSKQSEFVDFGAPPCLDLKSLAHTPLQQCVPITEQRLRFMQESLVNKIDSKQHNITIETAASVAEERCSRLNKSLHHLAEHNNRIFK